MFPSRAQCANHGPATGEREPPERAHTGRAHPDDAESRPNMAETRKREKHTPRPPEQRRGSPNRQEHEPQRTAEESNPTHNHVSEPISSRTQQPCWITVPNKGEKSNTNKPGDSDTVRNTTRAPATSEPTTAVAPTIRLHAPMSVKTRTTRSHHIHLCCFPQYQSRESNPHAQPGGAF